MASYKGIGFDATNGVNRLGTSADDISFAAKIIAADGLTVSAVGASVTGGLGTDTLTVTSDASVAGDLTVQGDIVSRGAVDLVLQDNFIDLNFANSTTTAESGGLTIQMNRASGFTAGTVTTFVAGSAGVSNPTFTYTDAGSSSLLAAGDVVVISGAAESGNDGLFVVSAVSAPSFPQTVTIKGIGTAAVSGSTPWAQNQFEADTGDSATAFKTDIFVQLVADGSVNFKDSGGSAYAKGTFLTAYKSAATESSFTANGSYTTVESTLQSAYNGGATITTSGSSDIAFTLSSGDFTIDSGSVNIGGTSALSLFNLDTSGAITIDSSSGGISLDAAGASNLSTSSGALSLEAAGGINIDGASAEVDITTTGPLDINTGAIDIDATGNVNIDAAAGAFMRLATNNSLLSLSSGGALTISSTSGQLSLDGSGQTVDLNSAALDIDSSGAITIDGTSSLSIDVADTTNLTMAVDAASTKTLSISASNANGSNVSNIDIDPDGALNLKVASSNALVLSSTALTAHKNIAANADTLDIGAQIAPFSELFLKDGLAFTAAADLTILDGAAQGLSIKDSTGNELLHINTAAADQFEFLKKIRLSSNGFFFDSETVTITSIKDEDNFASDSNSALATQQSIKAYVDANVLSQGQANFSSLLVSAADGTGVAIRDVVYVDSSGKIAKADASALSTSGNTVGIALNAAGAGADVYVAQIGKVGGFSGLNPGDKLYLSETTGAVTATAPSAANSVVFQIGYAVSSSEIAVSPRFIMLNG